MTRDVMVPHDATVSRDDEASRDVPVLHWQVDVTYQKVRAQTHNETEKKNNRPRGLRDLCVCSHGHVTDKM